MLITELQIFHVAGIIMIPQLTMMAMSGVKALIWKYSSHLRKGDLILLAKEEATIEYVNFSGLHVIYKKTGNHRTISVSQLDKLDVRKIS